MAGEVVCVNEHRAEVERLDECALTHETAQRSSPPLADDLQPVHVDVSERHLGQRLGLGLLRRQRVGRRDEVDQLAAVRRGEARRRVGLTGEEAALAQLADEEVDARIDAHLIVAQHHLRLERRLVRRIDPGEVLNQPLRHLLVQALRVARFDDVDRDIHEDLHEGDARLGVALARRVAVLAVRRDQRDHSHEPSLREELRHLRRSAHRLGAIRGREAQVLREAGAQVVAVDAVDVLAQREQQLLLERLRDRRLPRARETRHPQRHALLAEHLGAVGGAEPAVRARSALDDVAHGTREHRLAVARRNHRIAHLLRLRAGEVARRARRARVSACWAARACWHIRARRAFGAAADSVLDSLVDDPSRVRKRVRRAGRAARRRLPRYGRHISARECSRVDHERHHGATDEGQAHAQAPSLDGALPVPEIVVAVLVHRQPVVLRHGRAVGRDRCRCPPHCARSTWSDAPCGSRRAPSGDGRVHACDCVGRPAWHATAAESRNARFSDYWHKKLLLSVP